MLSALTIAMAAWCYRLAYELHSMKGISHERPFIVCTPSCCKSILVEVVDRLVVTDLLAKRFVARCEMTTYCKFSQSVTFALSLKLLQDASYLFRFRALSRVGIESEAEAHVTPGLRPAP